MTATEAILYLVPGAKFRHKLYPEIAYFTVASYDGRIIHTRGVPSVYGKCSICRATDCTPLSVISDIILLQDTDE